MGETRGGKYGRNLAIWVRHTFLSIPEELRKDYKSRFMKELSNYPLEPRKKGSLRNSGCVHELEGVEDVDINNPKEFARLVKEGIHLMYQKQTASRVLKSLLDL